MNSGLPSPGWYPDPTGANPWRWWSGDSWSDETRRDATCQPYLATRTDTRTPPDPGWYPDPIDGARWRLWDGDRWTDNTSAKLPWQRPDQSPTERRRLDEQVQQLRLTSPQSWGVQPVLLPLTSLVVVIVVGSLSASALSRSDHSLPVGVAIVLNLAIDSVLATSLWVAGRRVAAYNGGWASTFGLRARWVDLGYGAIGTLVSLLLRSLVIAIANAASHGSASRQAQNVHLHSVRAGDVALLIVATVVFAPIIEELMFRGLLLRTFMRRLHFWPAAVLSTVIFAVLHTYEVTTLTGALTLAASVACLGIVNCYLNRLTTRLTPGIIVHATSNLLAVVVLVAQSST
jgi:membrane protease YdiL (CAAX protease family)